MYVVLYLDSSISSNASFWSLGPFFPAEKNTKVFFSKYFSTLVGSEQVGLMDLMDGFVGGKFQVCDWM